MRRQTWSLRNGCIYSSENWWSVVNFVLEAFIFEKERTRLTSWWGTSIANSLYIIPLCHTLSNAFSVSNQVAAVLCRMFNLFVMVSRTLIGYKVLLCSGLKPYLIIIWAIEYTLSLIIIVFPIVFKKEIGRWFTGFLESWPGFERIIIVAFFYALGKYSTLVHST